MSWTPARRPTEFLAGLKFDGADGIPALEMIELTGESSGAFHSQADSVVLVNVAPLVRAVCSVGTEVLSNSSLYRKLMSFTDARTSPIHS